MGVMLGLYLRHVVEKDISDEDDIPGTDDLKERFSMAALEVENLNYDAAKRILYELLAEYPANKDVHMAIFNIVKSKPSSAEYHDIVKKIFTINDMSNTATAMINVVFNNYLKRALPSVQIDTSAYFGLLQRFRKSGYFDDANKILKVMHQKNEDGKLSENIAKEQLLLARSYFMKGDGVEANRLINELTTLFPETEAAKQVAELLEAKKNPSA